MKTLSLWQPWASLIADGRKRIETRSWKAPNWLIGQRIAIHAAKKVDKEATRDFRYELSSPMLPRGAIVATAYLDACVRFTLENIEHILDEEKCYGDFTPGRFGWFFSDVQKFEIPVKLRGHQGIFDWTTALK